METDIIAGAITTLFPNIPRIFVVVGIGILFLVVTWFGVKSLNYVMLVTLPIFLFIFGIGLIHASTLATTYSVAHGFSPGGLVYCAGVLMAFVVNATVAADVSRFLNPKRRLVGVWTVSIIPQLASFFGSVLLGFWIFTKTGTTDPGVSFVLLLGPLGLVLVTASQFRINSINLYSGSLSMSNFGRRALGLKPGRQIWMCILATVGITLTILGVYQHILSILVFESVFICAWVGVLVSVIITRRLGKSTEAWNLEKAPQYDKLGLMSLALGLIVGVPASLISNEIIKGVAPMLSLVSACVIPILATKRKII